MLVKLPPAWTVKPETARAERGGYSTLLALELDDWWFRVNYEVNTRQCRQSVTLQARRWRVECGWDSRHATG